MNIKFRVWCKNKNEWETDRTFIADWGGVFQFSRYQKLFPIREDTHVIMQYTGLKDKNGRDIYEGDIVKAKYYLPSGELKETYTATVEYDAVNPAFVLHVTGGNRYEYDFVICGLLSIEVIGNIYESPELCHKE